MIEMEQILEALQTTEGRADLINLYTSARADILPAILVAKELVGKDLDLLMNEMLKYGVDKTIYVYDLYTERGFSREEALALTLNARINISETMNNARK